MLKVVLSTFSAVLLILSFPSFDLQFLAWVGFAPLLFALDGTTPKRAFWLAYLCGALFFAGVIYWLTYVTVIGYISVVLYLALYFGFFGFFYIKLSTIHYPLFTLIIPSLWVSLEWLRAYLFTGFGWALLGYSQYFNLPVIQIADITGVWGVSWLVMMVNVAIKDAIGYMCKVQGARREVKSLSYILYPFYFLLFSLVYGYYKLHYPLSTIHYPPVRVSIIQGNIPQEQKWDEEYEEFIMKRYEGLTIEALKDKPDFIIWPETALPGFLPDDIKLASRLAGFLKHNARIPLLVGAPYLEGQKIYNSAVLIKEDGNIINRYDKLRLVPFGEYVPFGEIFPRIGRLSEIGDFSPGRDFVVFSLDTIHYPLSTIHFSVLICFEDIFPHLARRFVQDGAQFLVNITNDAWFGKTSAPYQHTQASVFRAVENRRPVVRAANTGLSCFISPEGRIYKTIKDEKGEEIFIDGVATADVLLSEQDSFYSKFGDVFVIVCIIIGFCGMIYKQGASIENLLLKLPINSKGKTKK